MNLNELHHNVFLLCSQTRNSALSYFFKLLPIVHFYTLNIVRNITRKLHKISTGSPVRNSNSIGVQCISTVILFCQFYLLQPFVYFYTLNFFWDITMKLQETSTRSVVHKWILLSRCAVHKNCKVSAKPIFGVIALCSFYIHILSVFGI